MAKTAFTDILMKCRNMEKVYPGTKALDDVDFNVYRGKVNVLIGENGAGKSTLMKQIAGIEQPSSGKMYLDEEEVSFKNTTEAKAKGIAIIHQELSLFPTLNVYQNMFMNNEQKKGIVVDNVTHKKRAQEVLERLKYPIDVESKIGDLRVGQQQMVEIARNLLMDNLKILIMDEPTSSLSQSEVQVLFTIMRDLCAQGVSIVYISHRLEEIIEIGDHVTILRDGKYVDDADVKDIDVPWIVQKMTGSNKSYPKKERDIDWAKQETVLEVKDLCLPKKGGGWLLDHVSFELKKGEILGIYGLMGAGRTEVFECLMGLRPEHTGEVYMNGEKMKIKNVRQQIDAGFAWVPEDRQAEGLVQTLDIEKNISLSSLHTYANGPVLSKSMESKMVQSQIEDIHIKVADKNLPILSLSGGNQQKCVIGKGILTNPKILLMDEPSRGIDIGAKTEVFDIINQYADKGLSILCISSELKEMLAIANRVVVLSNGIKTAEFTDDEITEDNLVLASYKGHHSE